MSPRMKRSQSPLSVCSSTAAEFITKWLDEWSAVGLNCLGFSKAFDSVNHRLLLPRRRGYDIAPAVTSWVECFLSGLPFQEKVNGALSQTAEVVAPRLCQRPDTISHLRQ